MGSIGTTVTGRNAGNTASAKNEIESLFDDDPSLYPDTKHSQDEIRQLAIGRTRRGRWLLVAFTLRRRKRRRLIRPISARYMNKKEIEHYEQEKES